MGTVAAFAGQQLEHILNNVDIPNIGDAAGLQNSATDGSLYVSLHTADPSAGDQTTNETDYTSYARVAVTRDPVSKQWTVVSNAASNANAVTFPDPTGGSSTVTHFGIGTDPTGVGNLLYAGALAVSKLLNSGVTPVQFQAGDLTVTVT